MGDTQEKRSGQPEKRTQTRDDFDKLAAPVLHPPLAWWPWPLTGFIGKSKLVELVHLINTARFALWNSYRVDHDAKDDLSRLWIRSLYWANAVIWVDSCEDLLCQTIWLTLGLHNIPRVNRKWYIEALAKCDYSAVCAALKAQSRMDLHRLLTAYHGRRDVSMVRGWANHLKHRGAFDFEGLELYKTGVGVSVEDKQGNVVFNDDDILPPTLNLEHSITVLLKVHKAIVSTVGELERILFSE